MKTLIALLLVVGLMGSATFLPVNAAQQLDPDVRDRVTAAAVQVAIDVVVSRPGLDPVSVPIPIGSGTIVSPTGLIITNAHVVANDSQLQLFNDFRQFWAVEHLNDTVTLLPESMVLLTSDGFHPPEPRFKARVMEVDELADLAILQITDRGDSETYPFIPLGDSESLRLGDPIFVFSFPSSGGDALTFTTGVVSGFNFDPTVQESPIWINTDAVISGGSSGGTAVNGRGELIGIPTQGAPLDCRPGDTNGDGAVTAADLGCIPTGGSIGQLKPVQQLSGLLSRRPDIELAVIGKESPDSTTIKSPPPTADLAEAVVPDDIKRMSLIEDVNKRLCWGYITGQNIYIELSDHSLSLALNSGGTRYQEPGPTGPPFFSFTPIHFCSFPWTSPTSMSTQISTYSGKGFVCITTEVFSIVDLSVEKWEFAVDPTSGEWTLLRTNTETGEWFTWIEPRSLPATMSGRVTKIETRVVNGSLHLLVNDVDVSKESGLDMPVVSGWWMFFWGARSLDGPFQVEYSSIVISDKP